MLIGILVPLYKPVEHRSLSPVKFASWTKSEVMPRVMQGLLVLLQLMQFIQGNPVAPLQPLKKLDEIVTDRINQLLHHERNLSAKLSNEEFQGKYKRLEQAAELPLDHLAEKITAYNEYSLPPEQLRQAGVESNFDKRVTILLEKLGVYDKSKPVIDAILNDRNKLRELKKKLQELDNEDKKGSCCEWDIIFTLF